MTVLIATGNAVLDDHLKKYLETSYKVNYVEELADVVDKVQEANVVVLSSYLPSTHEEDQEKELQSFQYAVHHLLERNIRIVFLTDTSISVEMLEHLFNLGVYDFIITEDGNVDLEDILNKVGSPSSAKKASNIIDDYAKQVNPKHHVLYPKVKGEPMKTLKKSELERYHHAEYNEQEAPKTLASHRTQENDVENETTNQTAKRKNQRRKTSETVNNQVEEPKMFAFWGASTNLGKRTLSQSYASQIAKLGYSVLYIEFDYMNPALALTTALSNQEKNLYQLSLSQDSFDLKQYIANKMDVKITKEMVSLFSEVPENLHFLGLPSGFTSEQFPSITNKGFLGTLISALKEVEFDAIVMNLPNQIDNLFSFPVMLESDVVFAVTTSSPVRINEYRKLKQMLNDTPLNMDKWEVIVNQVGEDIPREVCDQLLRERSILSVPYDVQRPSYELDIRIGSPSINNKMNELASLYGFMLPEPEVTKKKGIFGGLKLK
ncbi:AAA family ATPase [Virgibacillus halodenitrificans]|uniref:AAA family ATPase n=1 Tax=Virgibacillus halodenitrificans TaxID=1482 RepID=UPI000EF557AC|nr:hypothetical protein [Virgibacillus halodenitrificans]